jgi:hypothetical protein
MKEYEGEIVIVKSIDAIDERRAIKIGDKAEIVNYDEAGMPCILLKTGLAKGSIYCMNKDQLKVVEA